MRNLSIRTKSTLLTLAPLLLYTLIVTGFDIWTLNKQAKINIQHFEQNQMDLKKSELKQISDIGLSTITKLIINRNELSKNQAKEVIRDLHYGKNGYFFILSDRGHVIVNGGLPSHEGQNHWDVRDKKGNLFTQELIKTAKSGDGFYRYFIPKPNTDQVAEKLAYTIYISEWNWTLGTGYYIDDIEKTVIEMQQQFIEQIYRSVTHTLLIASTCLILTFIAVMLFSKYLVRPLNMAVEAMNDIGAGSGDLSKRLKVYGNDEVSALASGFNAFAEKIQISVNKISEASEFILETVGDLKTITNSSEARISLLVKEKDNIVRDINGMSTTAQEVAQNTASAAEATTQADKTTKTARKYVELTMSSTKTLVEEIAAAAKVVETLEQETKNISSVTKVINDISEQTNLLALNAAIEAARAGSQGRGFAVVADEVRNLANTTQTSTKKIQQMILHLEEGTKKAVTVMNQSVKLSEETVEYSRIASTNLNTVVEFVTTINQMTAQIASSTEQQSQVTEEINQNIQHISGIVEGSTANTHSIIEVSKKLSQLGKQLSGMVKQFGNYQN